MIEDRELARVRWTEVRTTSCQTYGYGAGLETGPRGRDCPRRRESFLAKLKRVLIVDDDREQHILLRTFLGHHGYETGHADTLQEAHRILANEGADAVILDVRLDHENGLDLLYALPYTHATDVPVIVCTSDSLAELRYPGAVRAAAAWLVKPCTLADMVDTVRRVIGPPMEE